MKKLYRSTKDKKIAGVFGGLAAMYDTDVSMLRLLYACFVILTGIIPFGLLYLIAWAIIPEGGSDTKA